MLIAKQQTKENIMKNQTALINVQEFVDHLNLSELMTLAKVSGKSVLHYNRFPKTTGKLSQFALLSDEQRAEIATRVEQRIDVELTIRQIKKEHKLKSLREVRELVCLSPIELRPAGEIAELVVSKQLDWVDLSANNVEVTFSPRQMQISDIVKQAKQASADNVESTRLARQITIAEDFAVFASDDKVLNDETIADFIKIECNKTGCAPRTIRQDVQQLMLRNVA
jgi:hypothetical protein